MQAKPYQLIYSKSLFEDKNKWQYIENFLKYAKMNFTQHKIEEDLQSTSDVQLRLVEIENTIHIEYFNPVLNAGKALKLVIDFAHDSEYLRTTPSFKKETIGKALAVDFQQDSPLVLDSTLGLAVDATFLLNHNIFVWGIEQNPLVYLCLLSAYDKLSLERQKKFKMFFGSAKRILEEDFFSEELYQLQGIYFDPMFPQKKKTALPKQEMQILKFLDECYEGDAPEQSFYFLRQWQKKIVNHEKFKHKKLRLVVKRSPEAPAFEPTPLSYSSKLIRYDVYEERIVAL